MELAIPAQSRDDSPWGCSRPSTGASELCPRGVVGRELPTPGTRAGLHLLLTLGREAHEPSPLTHLAFIFQRRLGSSRTWPWLHSRVWDAHLPFLAGVLISATTKWGKTRVGHLWVPGLLRGRHWAPLRSLPAASVGAGPLDPSPQGQGDPDPIRLLPSGSLSPPAGSAETDLFLYRVVQGTGAWLPGLGAEWQDGAASGRRAVGMRGPGAPQLTSP